MHVKRKIAVSKVDFVSTKIYLCAVQRRIKERSERIRGKNAAIPSERISAKNRVCSARSRYVSTMYSRVAFENCNERGKNVESTRTRARGTMKFSRRNEEGKT